jgi:hypothetical protein
MNKSEKTFGRKRRAIDLVVADRARFAGAQAGTRID